MIIAVIQGGLGNQLFQYAMAYKVAKQNNSQLYLQTGFYKYNNLWCKVLNKPKHNLRTCILQNLKIKNSIIDTSSLAYINQMILKKYLNRKYISTKGIQIPFVTEDLSHCRDYQEDKLKYIAKSGAYIEGYWQNYNYFNDILDDIREAFQANYEFDNEVKSLFNDIRSTNSVGVHIRRGDFVSLGWDKGLDYYQEGIRQIKKIHSDAKVFIFSDDKAWVIDKFSKYDNFTCVDINTKNKDLDEFLLLKECKHQIISESTFGWWAAYLNNNPGKKVFVPKDAVGKIFCEGWNII